MHRHGSGGSRSRSRSRERERSGSHFRWRSRSRSRSSSRSRSRHADRDSARRSGGTYQPRDLKTRSADSQVPSSTGSGRVTAADITAPSPLAVVAAIATGALRPQPAAPCVGGEEEKDQHRVLQRAKQVAIGKDTLGYDQYRLQIAKKQRGQARSAGSGAGGGGGGQAVPQTPDVRKQNSKRGWDTQMRSWRRALHAYDLQSTSADTTTQKAGGSGGGGGGNHEEDGGGEGGDAAPVDQLTDGRYVAQECPPAGYPLLKWLYGACDADAVGREATLEEMGPSAVLAAAAAAVEEEEQAGGAGTAATAALAVPALTRRAGYYGPAQAGRLWWPAEATDGPVLSLELCATPATAAGGSLQARRIEASDVAPGPLPAASAVVGDMPFDERAVEGQWAVLRAHVLHRSAGGGGSGSGGGSAAAAPPSLRPAFPPRQRHATSTSPVVTMPLTAAQQQRWSHFLSDPLLC